MSSHRYKTHSHITSSWESEPVLLTTLLLILHVSSCPDELKNIVNAHCSELKAKGISLGFLEKKHNEASSLFQPDFTSLIQLTRNVQLWPLMEYLAMLWQYKVTADFMTQACLRR